jgi:hypothetical protein
VVVSVPEHHEAVRSDAAHERALLLGDVLDRPETFRWAGPTAVTTAMSGVARATIGRR